MSNQLISTYYNALHKFKQYGGSHNETTLEHAFISLVNSYAERHHLLLVPKLSVVGKKGNKIIPDGVLKNALRLEFGYWESKDSKDDLDREIHKKLYEDGYPDRNILFEDTKTAVLVQEGAEVMRVSMEDADRLDEILNHFISFEPLQVKEFNKALEQFKRDVPEIVTNLRQLIETQAEANKDFKEKRDRFHELAQLEINPEITLEDVREMLIQHILTEDIFDNVFGNAQFHRFNNIARELETVLNTFMDYSVRQTHLQSIRSYYDAIRNASSQLADHHEKQNFLKQIYENFYKVYNPKGADRLGVVYTPNEIVRFMIESTDWLLDKHFGKSLGSKGVEILDPATGTGTFVAELIEYINPHDLKYKYLNEIHANEVAILPYYIANLNIEYTYQQKMNDYEMFKNICFVDTLDNTTALNYTGQQFLLGGISSENAERIKRQNEKKISVIIGNPPYNAKQPNYNFQNANRAYKEIDKRIKDTYIKNGTAQNQSAVYDMFTRFYRWSSDRIDKNGVICFITNNRYIDGKTFDGFRKSIQDEFDFAYIVDFGGVIRDLSGKDGIWMNEEHTIFGVAAAVGISVMWLIKDETKDKKRKCKIKYIHPTDLRGTRKDKLDWIQSLDSFGDIAFDIIEPDAKNNWINQTDNDWDSLLPLIEKDVKAGKSEKAIFKLFTNGIQTNRDEWVYDDDKLNLESKIKYFIEHYNTSVKSGKQDFKIKWSSSLTEYFKSKLYVKYDKELILQTIYRPFYKVFHYKGKQLNHRLTQNHYESFGKNLNLSSDIIVIPGLASPKDFYTISSSVSIDLNCLPAGCQYIPLFTYKDEKHENITDWALNQFQTHYKQSKGAKITKQDIFYYVYAVLHSPAYRKKYEQNLKREFPRLPFYADFTQWRDWGAELMDLHINYETQTPYPLERKDADLSYKKKNKPADLFAALSEPEDEAFTVKARTKLSADKQSATIHIDTQTALSGVPPLAWEYKLGNRSAIEWILDQYKEKKPKDATIAEHFNTYKFEDYKEQTIDLLMRVCNVSVKTMEIVNQMPQE